MATSIFESTAEPTANPTGHQLGWVSRVVSVVAVLGLAETAWIHLHDLSEKFAETPYLGVGYAALVIAAITAAALIIKGHRYGWLLGGAACAATIVGFTLTRTTGLPAATGDIGNWGETAGIYALVAEAVVVAAAAHTLTRRPGR